MNQRTRILAWLFGSVLAVIVGAKVVYPAWIEPLVTIDERIADEQNELDRLVKVGEGVKKAKYMYRDYVARIGSFDVGKVEIDVRAKLNELIEKHRLRGANVSRGRTTEDRKTKLNRLQVTVGGTGTLQSAIEFIKDIAEMPQLVRVGNVAISPAAKAASRGRGKKRSKEVLMNLRIPVEVLVLPQQRVVGRLKPEELTPPASLTPRHMNNAYALIWEGKPFSEYVPPVPLRANAGRTVTVKKGRKASLAGSATGGDGEYTYLWEPSTKLSDPASPKPSVDTKEAFTEEYMLTVTDGDERTATAKVRVTVNEPPPKPETPTIVKGGPPPPPAPPPEDKPWKDGRYMQIRQALLNWTGPERVGELMVFNTKGKKTDYYTVGAEFDGGELLYVHPTGAVARRNDDFFLYPIGGRLDEAFTPDVETALEYPALKSVADQLQTAAEAQAAKIKAEEEAKAAEKAEAEKKAKAVEGAKAATKDETKKAAPAKAASVQGEAKRPSSPKAAAPPKEQVTGKGAGDAGDAEKQVVKPQTEPPEGGETKVEAKKPAKRNARTPRKPGTRRVDELRKRLRKPGRKHP